MNGMEWVRNGNWTLTTWYMLVKMKQNGMFDKLGISKNRQFEWFEWKALMILKCLVLIDLCVLKAAC